MKSSISAKIPTELYDKVQEAIKEKKYTSNTECIIEGLNLLLRNPTQENTEIESLLQEKEKEIQNMQEEVNRSKEEYTRQIKDIESASREKSAEILRLQKTIQELPDRSEFAELKDGIDKLEAYIKDKTSGTVPEQPAPVNKADYTDGIPDQEKVEIEEKE
jgi:Arc/MetJ-type ribon-helix-helix transcriptional regulator